MLPRLDKISNLSDDDFQEKFVREHRPVVIRDLFKGQPIEKLAQLKAARKALSGLRVETNDNYMSALIKSGNFFGSRKLSTERFEKFIDSVHEKKSERQISEYPLPDELAQLISVPKYCRTREDFGDSVVRSLLFASGKDNFAHLHFDRDYRHVFLYQVFGRKKVILVDPVGSAFLNPVLHVSTLNLELLNELEIQQVLATCPAYETILEPGDAVYMPPTIWHFTKYLETGMSFNLRFGQSKVGSFFQRNFHGNMHLQNIFWSMRTSMNQKDAQRVFSAMVRAFQNTTGRGYKTYATMQNTFERLALTHCDPKLQRSYWIAPKDFIETQVRHGIAAGSFYPNRQKQM